jgi:hypothetical protein
MALLGLASQALQFRRPYPYFAPPLSGLHQKKCLIAKEKMGPRSIRMGPILHLLFALAAKALPAVCQKLGLSLEDEHETSQYCCGFFRLPLVRVIQHLDPVFNKQNIITGISYDQTLCEFAEIFPGTMRHTADIALRQAGFTDREIDILSDHSSTRSRSRYSPACADESVNAKLHTLAESAVAKYLGVA